MSFFRALEKKSLAKNPFFRYQLKGKKNVLKQNLPLGRRTNAKRRESRQRRFPVVSLVQADDDDAVAFFGPILATKKNKQIFSFLFCLRVLGHWPSKKGLLSSSLSISAVMSLASSSQSLSHFFSSSRFNLIHRTH